MQGNHKHFGQIGYEAYATKITCGWTIIDPRVADHVALPVWEKLPAEAQSAWQAAANAVIDAHIERK